MTRHRILPHQRDWLWYMKPSYFEAQKRDWLHLNDEAICIEKTRFGEKKFHIRNYPTGFRELLREARFEKAEQKLKALQDDKNSVLSYAIPFDVVLEAGTRNEALDLMTKGSGSKLHNDILRLLDALSGSTGDINTLWRVIDTVGLIGRFMGAHPLQRKLKTKPAKEKRAQKNDYWVQPFNKAIRQAHSKGLTGKDAVNAAHESLDGVRIPVGDRALRSRECELRTGNKRRK